MISSGKIKEVRNNQDNKCNICGFELEEGKFHIDHVKPKNKGGNDRIHNLQLLCISCHLKKNKEDGTKVTYPQTSYTSVCEICGKVIGGYTKNHSGYLLAQHRLTHKIKGELKPSKEGDASNSRKLKGGKQNGNVKG